MAERTTSAEDTQNQHCQCVHTNVDTSHWQPPQTSLLKCAMVFLDLHWLTWPHLQLPFGPSSQAMLHAFKKHIVDPDVLFKHSLYGSDGGPIEKRVIRKRVGSLAFCTFSWSLPSFVVPLHEPFIRALFCPDVLTDPQASGNGLPLVDPVRLVTSTSSTHSTPPKPSPACRWACTWRNSCSSSWASSGHPWCKVQLPGWTWWYVSCMCH